MKKYFVDSNVRFTFVKQLRNMKHQIKINTLRGWSQLIENLLKSIAAFNEHQVGMSLDGFDSYIKTYEAHLPKGIFNYSCRRDKETLLVFMDNELVLSFTVCEIHELKNESCEPNY